MRVTMSLLSSLLDAANEGILMIRVTISPSSLVLDAADDDESVIIRAG